MSREKENISKLFLDQYQNKDKDKDFNETSRKKKIMKEIELKTENIIINAFSTGQIKNPLLEKDDKSHKHNNNNQDILQSILSDSAKEFKEKMGRNMTYSEMREMYG